ARNMWWSWDHNSGSLFLDLDPARWSELNHNPVALLSEMPLSKLETRVAELMLHSRVNYAYRRMLEYLEADRTWGTRYAGVLRPHPVAYFSAEFGLHESLPVYSGGLGVLAGDHIKSASDLDIPLVGIGLFMARAISARRWIKMDGNRKSICRRIPISFPCNQPSDEMASPSKYKSRLDAVPSMP